MVYSQEAEIIKRIKSLRSAAESSLRLARTHLDEDGRRFAAGHNDVRTRHSTRSICGKGARSRCRSYQTPRPISEPTQNASHRSHLPESRPPEWISTPHRLRPLCEGGPRSSGAVSAVFSSHESALSEYRRLL